MAINPIITNIFLDSCAFDPKHGEDARASAEILENRHKWNLTLNIAYSTKSEISHPNTPSDVKAEAMTMVYTLPVSITYDERVLKSKIAEILAGAGKRQNVEQDAKHLFEAQKYGSCFVTTDKKILNRGHMLKQVLPGLNFLTPVQMLSQIKRALAYRPQSK